MADNGNEKRPDLTVDSGSQAPIEHQQKNISDRNEKGPTDFGAEHRPADENNDRDEGEGEAESESVASKDELRLSKARCIALVCTVTGASFLNVSTLVSLSQLY